MASPVQTLISVLEELKAWFKSKGFSNRMDAFQFWAIF